MPGEDGIMTNKAVVYTSALGKTRKIAEYVAKKLNADCFDLKKQSAIALSEYDHIIFGTGIHGGRPYHALVKFLDNNQVQMSGKKRSLFISCVYNAEKGEEQMKRVSEELGIPDAFFFNGKHERNSEDMEISVDSFIGEMSKR
jgi:menaquinone-dependent protoporphyrinogen oxidase